MATVSINPTVQKLKEGTGWMRTSDGLPAESATVLDSGTEYLVPPGGYYECGLPNQEFTFAFDADDHIIQWHVFGATGTAGALTGLTNIASITLELNGSVVSNSGGWSFSPCDWLRINFTRTAPGAVSFSFPSTPNLSTIASTGDNYSWVEWTTLNDTVLRRDLFKDKPQAIQTAPTGAGSNYDKTAIGRITLTGNFEILLQNRVPREVFFGITRYEDRLNTPAQRWQRMAHCIYIANNALSVTVYHSGTSITTNNNAQSGGYFATSENTLWKIQVVSGQVTYWYNAAGVAGWVQFGSTYTLLASATGHLVDICFRYFGGDAIEGIQWRYL